MGYGKSLKIIFPTTLLAELEAYHVTHKKIILAASNLPLDTSILPQHNVGKSWFHVYPLQRDRMMTSSLLKRPWPWTDTRYLYHFYECLSVAVPVGSCVANTVWMFVTPGLGENTFFYGWWNTWHSHSRYVGFVLLIASPEAFILFHLRTETIEQQ